jgi:hypothetical protein
MGLYINAPEIPVRGKAKFISELKEAQAVRLNKPEFIHPSTGRVTICIVSNAFFDAIAVAFDERELQVFTHPDSRPKVFFSVKEEH